MFGRIAAIVLITAGMITFNRYVKKQTERLEEKIQSMKA